ncbi:MAG: hypothetical protein LBS30_02390, partial [Planctomycetota bacterium]|nr:hypothetical protein [Planctomycetota bacterium]
PEPVRGTWSAGADAEAEAALSAPGCDFEPLPQDDFIPASPDADAGELALSEDSSAVGGERHGEPLPAFSFGSGPVSPAPLPPAPEPAPGEPPAPIGFAAPAPSPAVQPFSAAPQANRAQAKVPEDAPTQLAMRPLAAEPPQQQQPAPAAPAQLRNDIPMPDDDALKNETGGGSTTVLIRYTCPKCKTQGMQAVDKVGTVVNCSNCGKAMRLVMKK